MAAVISVIATANGKETDGSPAVFSFTRTGDTSTALSVAYQLFGTAQAGIDYTGIKSGTVTFAAGSSSATLSLPALADGALIDPYETIIARINPASAYNISPGKQFATATITAEGMVVIPKPAGMQSKSSGEIRNYGAFAALKTDGSVISWGTDVNGKAITAPAGLTGVSQIFSTESAFAALKTDGSVISWGESSYGGNAPAGLTGVSQIFSANFAFAALKTDGSVISWGASGSGGNAPAGLTGVSQIFSTQAAFAALKTDGSVISWGASGSGGNAPAGLTGVSQIFSTESAFAALKTDGSVISWGESYYGGNAPAGLTGVSQIFSNYNVFVALKTDGSVISWGDSSSGGNAPAGLTGVSQIFSTDRAFAALKTDGSVISWGISSWGGNAPAGLTGVSQIFSTQAAFAALKTDGSVISWGYSGSGGNAPAGLTGVSQIFSTASAFAALKTDGSVISWGDSGSGGNAPAGLTGVSQIFSNSSAFAALKTDGSVISWGANYSGGNAPAGLTGVVGFANPFTDDRLVIAATPTYTLTPSESSINEGSTLTTSVATTDVASGTTLYYSLSGTGINSSDFLSGALTGSGTISSSGSFSFSHTLANDLITEGTETLSIKLFSDSSRSTQVGSTASVSIADSSITPVIKNTGAAAFSISGKGDIGSQLSIIKTKDDPEGNGKFTYKWQSSVDGTNWTNLASTSSSYTIAATDASKQLRASISYLDGKSNSESVDTSALSIAAVAAQKVIAGDFATPVNISLSLPAYIMSTNWNIDKYYYYVEQYPMTLRTAFYADYLAGRYTNQALYGQNHYLTGGQAEGRAMVDTSGILTDSNDYGAYVENYGITLLDIYRVDSRAVVNGGTMSLFAWGKEHYNNWGKAEGREISGGVEWGGIVRNNLDLYNQWQDAKLVTPTLSAFAFGYQRQNTIKSTLGVLVGSDTADKLTGQIAYGLNGNDVICSDGGRGILAGGFGDDLLVAANGGSDLAYGGPGSDIFQLNAGSTFNIRDFRKGADMIQLGSTLTSSGVTMQWDSADNSTLFYNGSSAIGKVYGKRPTEFTYSDSTNGVSKVYI